jgi:hypothetical protein
VPFTESFKYPLQGYVIVRNAFVTVIKRYTKRRERKKEKQMKKEKGMNNDIKDDGIKY